MHTLLERLDMSSLHMRDARGRTALHWVMEYNEYAYDNPDASDEEAERPMPRAWVVDVVRALLLAGADHTIVDDQGMTPRALALTQKYGMHGIVRVLDVSGATQLTSRGNG